MRNISQDLSQTWASICASCFVALIFSYILIILLRYATKYVIWIMLYGIVFLFFIAAIVLLVTSVLSSSNAKKELSVGQLIAAAVFAIIGLVIGIILCCFRRRIRLVIQLFKEASKVLEDIPTLLVEPLLTFIVFGLTCCFALYFAIITSTAGDLEVFKSSGGKFLKALYIENALMKFANIVNCVGFIWFTSFILGCQHFVIASAVCQWFFTRTKSKLDSPLRRGFEHLLRYHIGSVCLGSILITMIKILRMIAEKIRVS